MAFHHGTLRNYTAALLDLFNNLEVQHQDSTDVSHVRSIPITYSSKEKAQIIDQYTGEQLRTGNYNVLPRANLSLSTMVKSEQRIMNKNNKIATKSNETTFEYMWNSVPYEFTFELSITCRGMNEASQIIEQIATKFNPTVNLDIWDAQNLSEPTRVPVRLLDIGIESEEYDEYSSNLINLSIGLSIMGNLYPPINTVQRIREFKMSINESYGTEFSKKIIANWDVDGSGALSNGDSTQVQDTTQYPPVIIDITNTAPLALGNNDLVVVYDDKDNKLTELTFTWSLIQGTGTLTPDLDRVVLNITTPGTIEVQVQVQDAFGNFASMSKTYTV